MSELIAVKEQQHRRYLQRLLVLALILGLIFALAKANIPALWENLTPPPLPRVSSKLPQQSYAQQNWQADDRLRFHHTSQGTQTIPIPLNWLLHLPQPSSNPLGLIWATDKRVLDAQYLYRIGFIPSKQQVPENPLGLAVGMAKIDKMTFKGLKGRYDAVGLTCAACHTGRILYNTSDTKQTLSSLVIDGAGASVDLSRFTDVLAAAMAQLLVSSKLGPLDSRFDDFARGTLSNAYDAASKQLLAEQLQQLVTKLAEDTDIINVAEGAGRLDALNRIGNQVFARNLDNPDNYVAIDAPVNFPHIWSASWFKWVQYDGSIMQPLVRNVGEALGVRAYSDVVSPHEYSRFASSIPLRNVQWMESLIAGDSALHQFSNGRYQAPASAQSSSPNYGLGTPPWPEDFPAVDQEQAALGAKLYEAHCQNCHLKPLSKFVEQQQNAERDHQQKRLAKVTWQTIGGQQAASKQDYLDLKIVPLRQVDTDPAQSRVLRHRRVNTMLQDEHGRRTQPLGLAGGFCTPNKRKRYQANAQCEGQDCSAQPPKTCSSAAATSLAFQQFQDGSNKSFAFALGRIVDKTIDVARQANGFDKAQPGGYQSWQDELPNCLRSNAGYKARPLNGIWATPPYLHNGSVASVFQLLSPPERRARAKKILLGHQPYDFKHMGLQQPKNQHLEINAGNVNDEGHFVLDTLIPGNLNTGHYFSDRYVQSNDECVDINAQQRGVIGPALDDQEIFALIEYLKTL